MKAGKKTVTMAGGLYLWLSLATIATIIFLNYPAPEFSQRLKAWQQKGKIFQYKEFNIFYIDEKGLKQDGSILLCIHGFPTSSHDWLKILGDLKKQYDRIILPDMLGYGFSDKPADNDYLITEQADILESIVTSLSFTQVHILSHDYGDTVALELLHRHNTNSGKLKVKSLCMLNGGVFPETNVPRPVQKISLVFTGVFTETHSPRTLQKLLLLPYVGDVMSRLTFYGIFKKGFCDVFGPQTQPSFDDLQDFYAAIRHKDGNIANSRLIHYITQRHENKDRWVGALQKTTAPVHMIHGPADPVNKPVFIDHYKKTVPSPSIDVLEEHIGHYPQWEAPDQVMESYEKFLKTL